jgi:hypothetical protein
MKKYLYIHLPQKSWRVKIEENEFDKEVDSLERILSSKLSPRGGSGACWIPVWSNPQSAEAHIYLTEELKSKAILETVVE